MQFVVKIGSMPWVFRGVIGWMPSPALNDQYMLRLRKYI
jgi:hypothetical protein